MQAEPLAQGKRQFFYTAAAGQTVYQLLQQEGYSNRLIIALKQTEDGLTVLGKRVRTTHGLMAGEILTVTLPQVDVPRAVSNAAVPIIYEDEDIAVYNKPAGMVCHRSGSHFADTLENTQNGVFRAMHRLDRDTSGALVTAKHQLAAAKLWQQIEKRYIAVVQGRLADRHGFITLPLDRAAAYEPRQIVCEDGKPAKTEYQILAINDVFTVVACTPHTGRMHQIRAHFAALGHPLAGDAFYGGETTHITRQALHCEKVIFKHPITHKLCCFTALIPRDMADLIAKNGLILDC